MNYYVIAGEASGDLLGARLMQQLKKQLPTISFYGIGGPQMEAQGLQSRIPMAELSLMGFVEIIPHIPRLKRLIKDTAADILAQKPDARGVVNICSGEATELRTLVRTLVEVSGKDIEIVQDPSRLRPGELRTVIGSPSRLGEFGATSPKTDYVDAVARLWRDTVARAA